MVSLARIDPRLDPDADLAGTSTILRLFGQELRRRAVEAHELGPGVPEGTLQVAGRVLLRQRTDIALSMRDELAP